MRDKLHQTQHQRWITLEVIHAGATLFPTVTQRAVGMPSRAALLGVAALFFCIFDYAPSIFPPSLSCAISESTDQARICEVLLRRDNGSCRKILLLRVRCTIPTPLPHATLGASASRVSWTIPALSPPPPSACLKRLRDQSNGFGGPSALENAPDDIPRSNKVPALEGTRFGPSHNTPLAGTASCWKSPPRFDTP